jgi:hypothetical protein
MSDLKKMKEVFDNQQKTDWPKIKYTQIKNKGDITLTLEDDEMGFVFSLRGRFIGVYNWKE